MEYKQVTDIAEIKKQFGQLKKSAIESFSVVHDDGWQKVGQVVSESSKKKYWIGIGEHENKKSYKRFALYIDSDFNKPQLEFVFLSKEKNKRNLSRGRFVVDSKGKIWIAHTGGFRSDKFKEEMKKFPREGRVNVVEKLSNIDSFLQKMIGIYEVDIAATTKPEIEKTAKTEKSGLNTGPKPHLRHNEDIETNALHDKITHCLEAACKQLHAEKKSHHTACNVDLLVALGEQRFLFEVKPNIETSSLFSAIGQLIVQGEMLNIDPRHCALVVPDYKKPSELKAAILSKICNQDFSIITYNEDTGFDGLERLMGIKVRK